MIEQIKEIIKSISFDDCTTCKMEEPNNNRDCNFYDVCKSYWKLSDTEAERIAKEILAVIQPVSKSMQKRLDVMAGKEILPESDLPLEKWLESKGFKKSNHFGYVCWINPIKTIKVCVTDDGQFKWIYSKDIESVEWLHIPVIKSRRQLELLLMALESEVGK